MALRIIGLITALALLAVACSPGEGGGDPPDLLVVVNENGDVALVSAGAAQPRTVADVPDDRSAFQPIWLGADGIVFVERRGGAGALVTVDTEGNEIRRWEFVTAPFYIYPRPGEGMTAPVVTLRNALQGGLVAELVEVDGTTTGIPGEFPFFFVWDGEGRVIAHIGNRRLDEVYPSAATVDPNPGDFAAPGVSDGGVVFVRSSGGRQVLSISKSGGPVDVAIVPGPAQVVAAGDRVAIRAVATGNATEVMAQTLPAIPPNALAVVDLPGAGVEVVTRDPVALFFWDKTGNRLLFAEVREADSTVLQWHVWESGLVTDFGTFTPPPDWMASFIPFFDQYANSMSLWSSDGSAFAYPAVVDGDAGVWVQALDAGEPERVTSGSWVAWGPGR